jgi:hypothetical protein
MKWFMALMAIYLSACEELFGKFDVPWHTGKIHHLLDHLSE